MSMQRIVEQDLPGNLEEATKQAVWTWNKDEIAWRYCSATHSISKVRFTGERWVIVNIMSSMKIYQFETLSSTRDCGTDKITHDSEEAFFETLEETRDHALKNIDKLIAYNTKCLTDNKDDIFKYCITEMTYTREVLTEKTNSL